MIELAAILLLALDRPLGGGTANIITRFDTDDVRAIPAVFLGSAETIPPVEWFLDGDGLLAPLAVSRFVPRPLDNDPPGIARGEYPIGHQGVDKPVFFRGVIHTSPPREVRLLLFPPDYFDSKWKQLAESGLPICLSGELPHLRTLLERHGIRWQEADLAKPETIDRNGLFICQLDRSGQVPYPGMAKWVAVFDTESLAFNRFLESSWQDRLVVFEGPISSFADEPPTQQLLFQLIDLP